MILAGCILAPDLSELNAFYGHKFFPLFSEYSRGHQPVNCGAVTSSSFAEELLFKPVLEYYREGIKFQ